MISPRCLSMAEASNGEAVALPAASCARTATESNTSEAFLSEALIAARSGVGSGSLRSAGAHLPGEHRPAPSWKSRMRGPDPTCSGAPRPVQLAPRRGAPSSGSVSPSGTSRRRCVCVARRRSSASGTLSSAGSGWATPETEGAAGPVTCCGSDGNPERASLEATPINVSQWQACPGRQWQTKTREEMVGSSLRSAASGHGCSSNFLIAAPHP